MNCNILDKQIKKLIEKKDWIALSNFLKEYGLHNATSWHAHHIKPRSKGGSDKLENLMTVCQWCHNLIHRDKL